MSPDKRTLDELIDDLPDDLKRVIVGELLKIIIIFGYHYK